MTTLEILRSGPLALVEDLGRAGLAHLGVGRSGAADRRSHTLANRLVANPDDWATVEVTFGGFSARVRGGDVDIAVTGADTDPTVNGIMVGTNSIHHVRDGQVISLGTPRAGLRTYLAVRGGVCVEPVLGSRSYDVMSAIGPSPLRAGDVLPVGEHTDDYPELDQAPVAAIEEHLVELRWVISLLYIGTFGSFIGFSFAFGQVLQINFIASGQSTAQASLHAAQIAFLGPLLGSLSRIYGGKLADRIGGGRVTLAAFCAMLLATGILISASTFGDHLAGPMPTATMVGYVIGFTALFILSGIGNGSVYKMIPSIFEARSHSLQISEAERRQWSRSMSGALIGLAGAVGALGGVGVNLALRESYLTSGTATSAFWAFGVFYLVASVLTWAIYVRRGLKSAGELVPATTAPAGLAYV